MSRVRVPLLTLNDQGPVRGSGPGLRHARARGDEGGKHSGRADRRPRAGLLRRGPSRSRNGPESGSAPTRKAATNNRGDLQPRPLNRQLKERSVRSLVDPWRAGLGSDSVNGSASTVLGGRHPTQPMTTEPSPAPPRPRPARHGCPPPPRRKRTPPPRPPAAPRASGHHPPPPPAPCPAPPLKSAIRRPAAARTAPFLSSPTPPARRRVRRGDVPARRPPGPLHPVRTAVVRHSGRPGTRCRAPSHDLQEDR